MIAFFPEHISCAVIYLLLISKAHQGQHANVHYKSQIVQLIYNVLKRDPYHQTTVSKLEMIQHRAARFVLNKPWHRSSQQHSITDMLNYLQWPSLKSRRRNARLILLFKIVRNLLVLPNHCLPQPTPVSYTRANNPLKFAQLQSRIDLYKYSFLPRTIIDWNNLKIDNINTINLDTFKNIIDKLNNL